MSGEPKSVLSTLWTEPLNWLLLALPVTVGLEVAHAPGVWVFLAASVAIIPLAGLMGRATENLAEVVGPGIGGLLNATLGNAAELIIALFALWKGPHMHELVKASITGSIVGNVLLILGLSIVAGGFRFERQLFNRTAAALGATLLGLAAVGLIIPSIFYEIIRAQGVETAKVTLGHLSEEIAVILAIAYALSLFFSLRTHRHLMGSTEEELPTTGDNHQPEWNVRTSTIVLLLATAGVAWMAEILVGAVEHAAVSLGMNGVFVGVIVIAIVGNAAEHSTAVLMAWKNKMDLSMNIAIGSGIQVALFIAPVLVLASVLMGHDPIMDLHFSPLEVVSVVIAVVVLGLITPDGETNWMEGVLLLAVYIILALAFYNLPITSLATPTPSH